jgi:hypothetical protein
MECLWWHEWRYAALSILNNVLMDKIFPVGLPLKVLKMNHLYK